MLTLPSRISVQDKRKSTDPHADNGATLPLHMAPSVLRSFIFFAILIVLAVGAVAVVGTLMEDAHQVGVPGT